MTCEAFYDPETGTRGFICRRGVRRKRCKVPGCDRTATKLCDYPVKRKKSGTCDMELCEAHATSVGDDLDHCPAHAKFGQAQPKLFWGAGG